MNFTATVYVFPQNTVLHFLNYLWLLLKCSAIGIGFNGAETNCGIARAF